MKHLKSYNNNNQLQIGNYVICKDTTTFGFKSNKLHNFLANNVGKFIRYSIEDDNLLPQYNYIIKYKNVPNDLMYYFKINDLTNIRPFSLEEILYHSKSKKDLETIITANKYNI